MTRRAFSVSLYCRHEGAVLLVKHKRLGMWLPIGGELEPGETPMEAACRELEEETGHTEHMFPVIHKVHGAPQGLLLYEEHDAGDKGLHMNFAFLVEVPHKGLAPNREFTGHVWVESYTEIPQGCPQNVREAMPFALTVGV